MDIILKGGAWTWGGNTWVLKKWVPFFGKDMDSITTVPVWVLFPDLETCLWSSKALSKLASRLGAALYADHFTTCKAKLSFARVLVELDVSKPLPTTLVVNTPYGSIDQRVEYEWVPHYCHCCKKLGHTKEFCRLNKPKTKPQAPQSGEVFQDQPRVSEVVGAPVAAVETVVDVVVEDKGGDLGELVSSSCVLEVNTPLTLKDGEGFLPVTKKGSCKVGLMKKKDIPILNMYSTLSTGLGETVITERPLESKEQWGDAHEGGGGFSPLT